MPVFSFQFFFFFFNCLNVSYEKSIMWSSLTDAWAGLAIFTVGTILWFLPKYEPELSEFKMDSEKLPSSNSSFGWMSLKSLGVDKEGRD